MKIIIITLALIVYLAPSNVDAASKNVNSDKALEKKWNKDSSLVKLMSQDDSIIYGVKGTLKGSGNSDGLLSTWTKTLFKASKRAELKGEAKKVVSSMQKWEFDCTNNKLYISKLLFYSNKGNVIDSSDIPENWQDPIPQTIGESMLMMACDYASQNNSTNSAPLKAQEIPPGVGKKGYVLETMNTGGYTYINVIDENSNKEWLSLPEIIVAVGDKIEYPTTPPLIDFTSKTLNRHFEKIMFIPGIRIYK